MKFYQELTLIPDPEIPLNAIWAALYPQLHIGLADVYNQHGINTIGVSFPRYHMSLQMAHNTLGNKLRLFAPDEATLAKLNIEKWLERLTDYIHIKKPAPVPEQTSHVVVKRYRYRPIEQQAKRHAERHNISYEAALKHCQTHRHAEIFPPFIKMKSESNAQPHPLVILQTAAMQAKKGHYNSYGFSQNGSTVPNW
ncbi:type I-F CRISPR-associated endoribonuclease Cas6/Csy4 [Suttonella ornithocola]|uniref:CRISPR-associated protein Cas6/Csy4, subtype I-F/YPEST n=1 Tax=Suttonella ornithocola TaxID=279832 RepID=A0A380MQY5_9GAMM|nr:type I-F CRISPR-associated endoribonuclease Cas6/Csy4 [Suttonella ornithocola]SUO95039.1 CRISPR-associated protein Cas6/Csy4, subtype I-F/YPEST [Suttonella ornithocola]